MNCTEIKLLETNELIQINGGTSIAYDIGAALGFWGRMNFSPGGISYALAVWNIQYS